MTVDYSDSAFYLPDNKKAPRRTAGLFDLNIVMRKRSVLGRPGSDLLFQALRLSTIGAEDFDGRVRDGIGYRLLAMTTRSAKDRDQGSESQGSAVRTNCRAVTSNRDYEASDLSRHPESASAV